MFPWDSISHHFNHRRGELYNSDQPLCIVIIHPVMSLEKDDIINLQQKLLETAWPNELFKHCNEEEYLNRLKHTIN